MTIKKFYNSDKKGWIFFYECDVTPFGFWLNFTMIMNFLVFEKLVKGRCVCCFFCKFSEIILFLLFGFHCYEYTI
jgi:hypothetical protein